MSLLKNLTTSNEIADERDSLGGGGVFESGLYDFVVETAYLQTADSGALALNVTFKTEQGRTLRQTFWMTSGTAKGCKNYYEDKQGNKQYLPGFIQANALALLTVGKEIGELETEDKVVKLYNKDAKTEVPTKVPMFTELLGQGVTAGVIKQVVDKTTKADDGSYVPTGETREENEVDKFFRLEDKKTTAEVRADSDAEFHAAWDNKWAGKVRDRSSKDGAAGKSGAPKAAGAKAPAAGGPGKSLFSKS